MAVVASSSSSAAAAAAAAAVARAGEGDGGATVSGTMARSDESTTGGDGMCTRAVVVDGEVTCRRCHAIVRVASVGAVESVVRLGTRRGA